MDDVQKDEFTGRECINCKWGTPRYDDLHQGDGSIMDTEAMDVMCEKTHNAHSVLDNCDSWEEKTFGVS